MRSHFLLHINVISVFTFCLNYEIDQIKYKIRLKIINLLNKGQRISNKNVLLIFIANTLSHLIVIKEKLLGTINLEDDTPSPPLQ